MKPKFYITTALPYASAIPHIGNVYEMILADAIARYKRFEGYDVFLQTGTDEHGQKIELKAKEKNISPQAFVDDITNNIKRIFKSVDASFDHFVRTTDQNHKKAVQDIFKKLYEQKDIYEGTYSGLYCVPCEAFYTESQAPDKLCPDCQRELQMAKEEAYFLKLNKYQDQLVKHIQDNPDFIQPDSRRNEMLNNFLKAPLPDLCVSRTSFKWGIPVSFNEKHVVYVWMDALSNYITGLGFDINGNHQDRFNQYWPADIHLIGKDILRFHTIYWPIILLALKIELPKQIFGHPWILMDKGKMSKSAGNILYVDDLLKHYSVDVLRYFVLHEIPFASDGVISHELIMSRANSDLTNTLGNLINRTLAMIKKYFNDTISNAKINEEIDYDLIRITLDTPKQMNKYMAQLKVSDAIEQIMVMLRRANKYIDETMPWNLAKSEETKKRLETVLFNLLEVIRFSGILLEPFIPASAKKIQSITNTKIDDLSTFGTYSSFHAIKMIEPLFNRFDIEAKLKEIALISKEEKPQEENFISIDEFSKVDLKIGKIIESKKHENSDKLLVSKVDLKTEIRQIVSGIAEYYKPEEIVGKKVLVVTNLKPIMIRGVLSEGMLLCASHNKHLELLEAQTSSQGDKIK